MKALLRLGFMGVVTIAVVTNAAFAQRARQPAEGNMLQGDINRPRQSVQGNMPQGDINRPPRPAPMRPHPSRADLSAGLRWLWLRRLRLRFYSASHKRGGCTAAASRLRARSGAAP